MITLPFYLRVTCLALHCTFIEEICSASDRELRPNFVVMRVFSFYVGAKNIKSKTILPRLTSLHSKLEDTIRCSYYGVLTFYVSDKFCVD
jgi:hypothetical protein